jgi:hypothetical protein
MAAAIVVSPFAVIVAHLVGGLKTRPLAACQIHSVCYHTFMIPPPARRFFWDVNTEAFDPRAYPDYTIARVLEYGDEHAVSWLKETFSQEQIKGVIRSERRLSRKSATFWALVYHIPAGEVAALQGGEK